RSRKIARMERVLTRWRARRWLRTAPLQGAERLAIATVPVFVFGVFAVAWGLEPDARGLGTHEQLKLLPCISVRAFDVPCPFCGMTTSFAHFADGDPAKAFWIQPAGAVFFVLA